MTPVRSPGKVKLHNFSDTPPAIRARLKQYLADLVDGKPTHYKILRVLTEHPETRHWIAEYLRVAAPELDSMKAVPVRTAPSPSAQVDAMVTAFYPQRLPANEWSSLLAYLHIPSAADRVSEDAGLRLRDGSSQPQHGRAVATTTIPRGAEITVAPRLHGCRCNPRSITFEWLEDWHCAAFRLQPDSSTAELGVAVNGKVSILVGPVVIGEVKIWAYLPDPAEDRASVIVDQAAPIYQSVFPSYSHADTAIVARLEKAYEVLGMTVLRDARTLRSGEEWSPTLLRKITEANLFQLYWSTNASKSSYVDQEWRHALSLGRPGFIRPCFWEEPMPPPPAELSGLHFATLG